MTDQTYIEVLGNNNYCGEILKGPYSFALKSRVADCIASFSSLEKTGTRVIPYLAAWHTDQTTEIWYEFVGRWLPELLDCTPPQAAEILRRKIIEHRSYNLSNPHHEITVQSLKREDLNGARPDLRKQAYTSETYEAVYKVSGRQNEDFWLKDQAVIERYSTDRICLSVGQLTSVSMEMEAAKGLEKQHDRLKITIDAQKALLQKLAARLKQVDKTEGHKHPEPYLAMVTIETRMELIIQTINRVIDTRDPYTANHQKRTTDLAVAIAQEMQLSKEQCKGIQVASSIHDMGKIAVPSEILSKPGRLNSTEFELIKRHPKVAVEILKGIRLPWPVDRIILEHHEAVNGSGYPQGLTGDKTLTESKVLSVADVVETITSHRPYRPGLGIGAALEEITINRNVLYDSNVVDACLRLFNERKYQLH